VSELLYNLRLVGKSLRRDRWFTVVMVVSQALSVSIFVTALSSAQRYSNMTGQVRPDVFRIELNHDRDLASFYKGTQFEGFGEVSANYVSLPTARALSAAGAARGETVSFMAVMSGGPAERPPGRVPVRLCDADLFALFRSDFRYGGPWTRADETATPPVPAIVLTELLNKQLYGGVNSVGRTLRIAGRDFRIVGVLRQRPGKLHLWDFGIAPENHRYAFVPFAFADELRPLPVIAWPAIRPEQGWKAVAASSSGILEYWVRLPTAETQAQFRRALAAVAPQFSLHSADEIAGRYARAPAPYRVFVILTLVVLELSVINVMRMLLAKASARAAEIGIHRALGAGRNVIFARQLIEGVLVSMAGSVAGLALAVPTVAAFDTLIPDTPIALAVTPAIAATALLVCLGAGLVSGIYPAWRIAAVAPTRYLGKV
jgi:putative ABC transport system permease protein